MSEDIIHLPYKHTTCIPRWNVVSTWCVCRVLGMTKLRVRTKLGDFQVPFHVSKFLSPIFQTWDMHDSENQRQPQESELRSVIHLFQFWIWCTSIWLMLEDKCMLNKQLYHFGQDLFPFCLYISLFHYFQNREFSFSYFSSIWYKILTSFPKT